MVEPNVNDFVTSVKKYCSIPDRSHVYSENEIIIEFRSLILKLIYNITSIEDTLHSPDPDEEDVSKEIVQKFIRNLKPFPFDYYYTVVESLEIEQDDPCGIASIFDDLIDIFKDLYEGLQLYNKGFQETAYFHWSLLYSSHWGLHATSALKAIEEYRTTNYLRKNA